MGIRGTRTGGVSSYQEVDLFRNVEDILQKARQDGLYIGRSLDMEKLISCYDIELRYEPMDSNQSGTLKYERGIWVIEVNESHHRKRQRFTMAHELGHYFLHKEKNVDFVDTTFFRSSMSDSVEYAANEFAAKLLMPELEVKELINEGVKNLGELAEKFDVSVAAMKYRVVSMGYKLKDNV
jgi:Zn-dependent peptidase ImmA (M78 family)